LRDDAPWYADHAGKELDADVKKLVGNWQEGGKKVRAYVPRKVPTHRR
jgi:hypothetical protein